MKRILKKKHAADEEDVCAMRKLLFSPIASEIFQEVPTLCHAASNVHNVTGGSLVNTFIAIRDSSDCIQCDDFLTAISSEIGSSVSQTS